MLHISIKHKSAIPANVKEAFNFRCWYKNKNRQPIIIIKKLRHASEAIIASRISVRFATNGAKCSAGSACFKAAISCVVIKPEKKAPGATAKINATPAVSTKVAITPPRFSFNFSVSGLLKISFKAKIANKGMVNSAITRMEDTARNLLYIGT